MKPRIFLLATMIIALGSACDRRPQAEKLAADRVAQEQREQDERRFAELRDVERRATEREAAARAAETDLERKKIASERAELDREKERLLIEQRKADETKRLAERTAAAELARGGERQVKAEQTLEFFYDALDPQGEWIEVERYGYCWSPNVARNSRWRPYTDGNWAWTDYGWTWASNEPFGWATYHYGRWAHVKRLGWVWVPGSEWAPAWVAWRRGDQFVGWAPLPPEAHSGSGFTAAVDSYYDIGPSSYAFVPVEVFGEPTYVGSVVEPQQNVTIINKTVNVTNITYQTVQNKTVVHNAGPELDLINRRSKQPVRAMTVERVVDASPDGTPERRGNTLRLIAPLLKSAANPATPPRKIRERARADEVDRGWGEINPQNVQTIRTQQTREARTAEEAQRAPRKSSAVERPPETNPQAEKSRPDPASPAVAPTNADTGRKQREAKREENARDKAPGEKRIGPRARPAAQLPAPATPTVNPPAATRPTPAPTTPQPVPPAAVPAPSTPDPATPVAAPATPRAKKAGATKAREKREKKQGETEPKEN